MAVLGLTCTSSGRDPKVSHSEVTKEYVSAFGLIRMGLKVFHVDGPISPLLTQISLVCLSEMTTRLKRNTDTIHSSLSRPSMLHSISTTHGRNWEITCLISVNSNQLIRMIDLRTEIQKTLQGRWASLRDGKLTLEIPTRIRNFKIGHTDWPRSGTYTLWLKAMGGINGNAKRAVESWQVGQWDPWWKWGLKTVTAEWEKQRISLPGR